MTESEIDYVIDYGDSGKSSFSSDGESAILFTNK